MCITFWKKRQKILRAILVAQTLFLFLLGPVFSVQASNLLHDQKLTLNMNGVTIKNALEEIQRQTNLSFVFNERDLQGSPQLNLNFKNKSAEEVLNYILKNTDLGYSIVDGVILIRKEKEESGEPQAKKRIIKGIVTDERGEALPGVTVKVKGLNVGVATDINGKYELIVDERPGIILEFSYVGMTSREEKIGNRTEINVQMQPASTDLEEVMVVAYGTVKKEAFTGSAVSVKGDDVIKAAASKTSPERALQGNVAGVRISRGGGQPGTSASVQVRGIGSLNESTAPLYIVDGVPTSMGLDMLNMDDVETMSVLKDAAATSLYGARAANGVIVITTKQGKEGKVRFDVSYERAWATQVMPRGLKGYYMNSKELTEYSIEALKNKWLDDGDYLPWQANYGSYNSSVEAQAQEWALKNLHLYAKLVHPDDPLDGTFDYSKADLSKYLTNPRSDDWYGALFKKFGSENKVNVSARGGNSKLQYYASLGYVDQSSITEGSDYKKYSGRIALTNNLSKRVHFSLSEAVTYAIWNQQQENNYASPIAGMYYLNPTQPIYLSDGTLNPTPGWQKDLPNYIEELGKITDRTDQFSSITNGSVTINLTEWLHFKTINGFDISSKMYKYIMSPESKYGKEVNGSISQSSTIWKNLITSNTLNFDKSFDKHNVTALFGYEAKKYTTISLSANGENFPTYKLMYLRNASKPTGVGGTESSDRIISYISKVDYNYDNKYYLSGSFRRDGTCRFLKENRWGNFWSVSGAWNITREKFMQSTSGWLDNLRLKLSYGTNGNQPGGQFQSQTLWSVEGKYYDNPAIIVNSYGNKKLTWENSYTWNAGIDFSLWSGRFKAVVEYYNKHTKDLIDNAWTSDMSGWGSIVVNEGELRNTGVEITVDSRNIVTDNFTWTTNFNISYMRAMVEKMKEQRINGSSILREGEHIHSVYTRQWAGVDPETGRGKWKANVKDENDQVVDSKSETFNYNQAERVIVGKIYPDWFGGLTNRFSYKGIELSFLLTFTIGGKIWDSDRPYDGNSMGTTNWRRDHDDNYWKKPGDKAKDPIVIFNNPYYTYSTSTRQLKSSNHLRVKTLTLAYNLPKQWVNKIGLNNVRVYANGNDILTFYRSKYLNPEGGLTGGARGAGDWPSMKSWRIGINVSF